MAVLSSKQILQEKNTNDPNSITALTLTHKALSDVLCLGEFKNLERLDLGFNSLTSLEGLRSCVNLKWLSVVQNKLESLKGIEGLNKLTVLNAGKNKLKSMNEVASLIGLRAIILNDNEIVSICKLDQMKELNTLVLSRNPICEVGDSLKKTKSMTKLSLSNCQLQTIGSSLKSCTELKELRLAHNDIKIIPVELAHNAKLQNLDLGNNLITKRSDLKVLSSLINLKNLNLQGNPIAEKESFSMKIKKLLPNLHVFNSRLTDKINKNELDRAEDSPTDFKSKLAGQKDVQINAAPDSKKSKKRRLVDQSVHEAIDNMEDLEMKGLPTEKQKSNGEEASGHIETVKEEMKLLKKKLKKLQNSENHILENAESPRKDSEVQNEVKHKKQKTEKNSKHKALDNEGDVSIGKKELDRKLKGKVKQRIGGVLDDVTDITEDTTTEKVDEKSSEGVDANGGVVTYPTKKIKHKIRGSVADALELSVDAEVGLGGPSTWDD